MSQEKLLNTIKFLSISVLSVAEDKGCCLASEYTTRINGSFPCLCDAIVFPARKTGNAFLIVQYFL